jgi:hypothetical protein
MQLFHELQEWNRSGESQQLTPVGKILRVWCLLSSSYERLFDQIIFHEGTILYPATQAFLLIQGYTAQMKTT